MGALYTMRVRSPQLRLDVAALVKAHLARHVAALVQLHNLHRILGVAPRREHTVALDLKRRRINDTYHRYLNSFVYTLMQQLYVD